jgi:microfibrillar-associated protein 1
VRFKAEADEEKGGHDAEESEEDDEEEDEEEVLPATSAWGLGVKLVRPVFRRKDERTTLQEAELIAAREQAEKESAARAAAARAEESRRMVAEALQRDEEVVGAEGDETGATYGRPDDSDRPDEAAVEIDEWRLREIRRLKRDDEAMAETAREKAETERRRGLSAEERSREDRERGDVLPRTQKDPRGFHRGAFYVDESSTQGPGDIRLRPVVEDATFDRTALPSVMRGPRFGRKGQRRLEHVPTDTSRPRDDLLANVPSQVRNRVERGRGGRDD